MKKQVLIPLLIVLGALGYFGYKQMQPAKVGLSGKEFDDSKSAKLKPGMPVYDNLLGKWSNDKKTIEIRDGKFFETVNGATKEYEFVMYMHLPEACYPEGTQGDAIGFTVKNGKEVRCFGIRKLLPNEAFGYVEVTNKEDVLEEFVRN